MPFSPATANPSLSTYFSILPPQQRSRGSETVTTSMAAWCRSLCQRHRLAWLVCVACDIVAVSLVTAIGKNSMRCLHAFRGVDSLCTTVRVQFWTCFPTSRMKRLTRTTLARAGSERSAATKCCAIVRPSRSRRARFASAGHRWRAPKQPATSRRVSYSCLTHPTKS